MPVGNRLRKIRTSVDSLADFLASVQNLRDEWEREDEIKAKRCGAESTPVKLWFRGQSKASWPLKPRLYRLKNPDEREIRSGFKRRALQLMTEPHLPENEKGWYFLMQHYGAPTRLLDWTDGAFLGLYFAIRELKRPRDAAVWILDPEWLSELTLEESYVSGVTLSEWKETDPWFPMPFEEDLHAKFPLAIEPPHVARRLAVQRSCFTIFGTLKEGLSRVGAGKPDRRLLKITSQKSGVTQALKVLATCGIVETTVFPDLEGLSRELTREFGGG